MSICVPHVLSALRGQKIVLYPLELELKMILFTVWVLKIGSPPEEQVLLNAEPTLWPLSSIF